METSTHTLSVDGIGDIEVTVSERGEGHPILVMHGGGGPQTVTGWADQLADAVPAHVFTPTHPGFAGTPRPGKLDTIAGLAAVYVALLDELGLTDVTVVGNSIGGWIAAEIAILHPARVSSYVIVDAVGIEVAGHPVADFFSLTPSEVAQRSYHDPATFGIDPTTPGPVLFAGTDRGVFRSVNGGDTWRRYGPAASGGGLPTCAVIDLRVEPQRSRILVGTQGRGAWSAPLVFCYPDMNDDGRLTIADFSAFLVVFAQQSPRANCDGSTALPTLNVQDFTCFLQRYAAGCPAP